MTAMIHQINRYWLFFINKCIDYNKRCRSKLIHRYFIYVTRLKKSLNKDKIDSIQFRIYLKRFNTIFSVCHGKIFQLRFIRIN